MQLSGVCFMQVNHCFSVWMLDVTEYGHKISMTTSARWWGGESRCSEWLRFVSKGAGLMAPPIGARFCTVMFFWSGGMMYIWPVNTWRESVGVLQVTGSLLHEVLACRLDKLIDCLSPDHLQVPRVYADSLLHLWRVLDSNSRTVSQDRSLDMMATGPSPPGADRKGIDFQVDVHIPWNARRHL